MAAVRAVRTRNGRESLLIFCSLSLFFFCDAVLDSGLVLVELARAVPELAPGTPKFDLIKVKTRLRSGGNVHCFAAMPNSCRGWCGRPVEGHTDPAHSQGTV